MSQRWCLRIDSGHHRTVQALRLTPRVSVLEQEDGVWLRGEDLSDELSRTIRAIPNAEMFVILSNEQLRRPNQRVPCGRLPDGDWIPVHEWIQTELPVAMLSGRISDRASIRLRRSDQEFDSNVVVMPLEAWTDYAASAPQVRLIRWMFAASNDQRVVVRGTPLPPLPGQFFYERDGIAVPAGFEWTPRVDAQTIRSLISVGDSDLVLMNEDGGYELVRSEDFVRATRSAVRLSAESAHA